MESSEIAKLRQHLGEGQVIPALPLALDDNGRWSTRHQRALLRYYLEAGVGGIAVGVHTTQFEIRDPEHALFEPVVEFCSRTIDEFLPSDRSFARIVGVCGDTRQASGEAEFAHRHGYDAALLSLAALGDADDARLIAHCRAVAEILPLVGFYLQPAIGGRSYGYSFWREFATIENVVAIKIAPFDRYATLDVVRAVADSGRNDIALFTGNDDNIVHDLLTPFRTTNGPRRIVGGLLGQWAIGARRAVELLDEIREGTEERSAEEWAGRNAELTDLNSAIFDPANGFAGCLSGINEMLRRDGLVPSNRCLCEDERLSPGQAEELDRVSAAYPQWLDTEFIRENLERWLAD